MGGVLAAGVLLALVSLVPVVEAVTSAGAPAASVAGPASVAGAPSAMAVANAEMPVDSGPIMLLLVAAGIASMGLLSREAGPSRG